MNRTAAKIAGESHEVSSQGLTKQQQQQHRAYLHTRTGKGTKISSLTEFWHETVLQMEGYLIIFEVSFHPMVAKRRELVKQVTGAIAIR